MSPAKTKNSETIEALERYRLLYRIGRLIQPEGDSRRILRSILHEIARALRASSGSVALLDDAGANLIIEEAFNIDDEARRATVLKVGEGVTGLVAKTGKPLRVNDVGRSKRYVAIREGIRSEMAAPLSIEGRVIGVLNLDSDRLNAFSAHDEELLSAAALEAARVIHVSRLREEIQRQNRKLETLYRVGETLASVLTLNESLNVIAADVRAAMNAKICSIMLLDAEGHSLSIQAVSGAAGAYSERPPLAVAETLVGRVVLKGEPLAVRDVLRDSAFRNHEMARREGLCSLLSVPIAFRGSKIGVLNIYTGKPKDYTASETRLLIALAGHAAVAIEHARNAENLARAEEQTRRSEKLSLLGAMAAEIAHEIRNPITIIQMLIDSLGDQIRDGDPRRKDVSVINAKLRQINRIVDQALNVARTGEERIERFNVHECLDDALLLTHRKIASSAIELKRRFARNLPAVVGDRVEIEQALMNLILNACQAMPQGGKLTVATRLRSRDGDSSVAIRITDTGPGIAPDKMEDIFTPFYTTRKEGVGMGLFVARRAMRNHSGDLLVHSRPGEGAVFEALLPAAG